MIHPSLNIAWLLAELEASAAGFDVITPNHFWIGCCNLRGHLRGQAWFIDIYPKSARKGEKKGGERPPERMRGRGYPR